MIRLGLVAAVLSLAACNTSSGGLGGGGGGGAQIAEVGAPSGDTMICTRQQGAAPTPSAALREFLATRPTAAAFRDRYPAVTLVLPGEIATRERRLNCSRFFADTDSSGRIVSGRFT